MPLNLAAGEAHGARALLCAPAHLLLPNPIPLTLHLGEPDQPPQSPVTALSGSGPCSYLGELMQPPARNL